jgi:TrAA12-like
LWGVENGVDQFKRTDLGDVHRDNPCEELNRLGDPRTDDADRFFGYPQCHSEYCLPSPLSQGPGTQWSHEDYFRGQYNDEWCRDETNVVQPVMCMEAHVAPLDINFLERKNVSLGPAVRPGDAFVSNHGSWNRDPPQGYKVLHLPFADTDPEGCWSDVLSFDQSPEQDFAEGDWPVRPVGVEFQPLNDAAAGRLLISSDDSGAIYSVQFDPTAAAGKWERCSGRQTPPDTAACPSTPWWPVWLIILISVLSGAVVVAVVLSLAWWWYRRRRVGYSVAVGSDASSDHSSGAVSLEESGSESSHTSSRESDSLSSKTE